MERGKSREILNSLTQEMVRFYQGDPNRIQHFIKVHSFAKLIGESEKLDADTLFVLEAASIVHDIGIKPAEEKYGNCNGKLQEQEGPAFAEEMLKRLGFSEEVTARVSYLVGHHHTYTDVDGMDYRILLEADFLVNLFEEYAPKKTPRETVCAALANIFRTKTGENICRVMFDVQDTKQ